MEAKQWRAFPATVLMERSGIGLNDLSGPHHCGGEQQAPHIKSLHSNSMYCLIRVRMVLGSNQDNWGMARRDTLHTCRLMSEQERQLDRTVQLPH